MLKKYNSVEPTLICMYVYIYIYIYIYIYDNFPLIRVCFSNSVGWYRYEIIWGYKFLFTVD